MPVSNNEPRQDVLFKVENHIEMLMAGRWKTAGGGTAKMSEIVSPFKVVEGVPICGL